MTRFGMQAEAFEELARLMSEVILHSRDVKKEVTSLRARYLDLHYCFSSAELGGLLEEIHNLVKI